MAPHERKTSDPESFMMFAIDRELPKYQIHHHAIVLIFNLQNLRLKKCLSPSFPDTSH